MEIKRIRSKIVMLPTGKEMCIGTDKHWFTGRHLIFNEIEQHLYFTTEEEIKEGDSFYDIKLREIFKNEDKESMRKSIFPECKKIVATTDTSLGLPQPTTAFIKKYVELDGIDEVDLEYEDKGKYIYEEFGGMAHDTWVSNLQLKVNHNTITIHAIKDSWSRDEVEKLQQEAFFAGIERTGKGWNGEYAEGNNPNIPEMFKESFQEWINNK